MGNREIQEMEFLARNIVKSPELGLEVEYIGII